MKAELVKKEGNKVTLKITVDNNKFEEAVNKASIKPILSPLFDAMGKFKSIVPIIIRLKKPTASTAGGFN